MSASTAVSASGRVDGTAPRGAWWVAFRLQRSTLSIGLGLMAAMACLVLWHRFAVLDVYAVNAAELTSCQALTGDVRLISPYCADLLQRQTDLYAPWQTLRTVWVVLPSIIGAASGAALFSREFERRTQVFTLTQSVSARRWFLTKVLVGVVPLALAAVGVGFLFESTANASGVASWTPVEAPTFSDYGFVPGAVVLVSFALGVVVSTLVRQSLGAVLAAGVLALGLLWCLVFGYQDLGPIVRLTSSQLSDSLYPPPARAEYVGSGFLDAAGREIQISYDCSAFVENPDDPGTESDFQRCFSSQGATLKFADLLPLSSRAPLTWTVSGIAALLSAAFLTIGYTSLRRRVM